MNIYSLTHDQIVQILIRLDSYHRRILRVLLMNASSTGERWKTPKQIATHLGLQEETVQDILELDVLGLVVFDMDDWSASRKLLNFYSGNS